MCDTFHLYSFCFEEPECASHLKSISEKLKELSGPTIFQLRDAENTREFWKDSSSELNVSM